MDRIDTFKNALVGAAGLRGTWAALEALARKGRIDAGRLAEAKSALKIDPAKANPSSA